MLGASYSGTSSICPSIRYFDLDLPIKENLSEESI